MGILNEFKEMFLYLLDDFSCYIYCLKLKKRMMQKMVELKKLGKIPCVSEVIVKVIR